MISKMTPLGAFARGIAAGVLGALAQNVFFKATAKVAPETPKDAFAPPDPRQQNEQPTQTVARRFVEDFMQRGPIDESKKDTAGMLVHVGFGALWGGVYGIVHGSHRALRGPLGVLAFGTLVWMASDNGILPAFRLAAPMTRYPAKTHLYAWLAHLVYGGAVWAAFEGARARTWMPIVAPIAARYAVRNLPAFAKPAAYRVIEAVREQRPARRVRDAAIALSEAL